MSSNSNTRDLQILLMGKTGVGKSATANTILADGPKIVQRFESQSSSLSVTQSVQKECNTVDGRKLTVVDTPGVCDTDEDPETTLNEISGAIINCPDGYDAFVIVMRYPMRLTNEERQALLHLEQLFGEDIYDYTIGLFTGGSTFEHQQRQNMESRKPVTTFEEEILKDVLSLKKGALGPVVKKFKGGVVLFENFERDEEKRKAMVSKLVSKIDNLLHNNKNKRYDDHIFKNVRLQMEKIKSDVAKGEVHSELNSDKEKKEGHTVTGEVLNVVGDRLQNGVVNYIKTTSGCTIL